MEQHLEQQKVVELIAGRAEKVLEQQEFKRQKNMVEEEHGSAVLYIGENSAYSILYNQDEKKFELRSTLMTDEGPDDKNWKVISSWIYDMETDTQRDAETIADDFCNTLDDSKRRAAIRAAKRKATKDEDNNPGPVFFFKRLAAVFPELREEIAIERESYEEFRAVTFAKASVVPKIDAYAKNKNAGQLKKLCGIMEDMYEGGDLDVRAIITMVVFNGLSDASRENLLSGMSDAFRKHYKQCVKYKTKTVRPEKIKRSAASRAASSGTPERLTGKVPKEYRK